MTRHETLRRGRPSRDPRRNAVEVISLALDGHAFAQDELDERGRAGGLSDADRRLMAEIAYGVIRRRMTLDSVLAAVSTRPLKDMDPALLQVMRVGACQILFMDRVPDHAAVNESVRLARSTGHARGAGFVNAVLRQLTRVARKTDWPEGPPDHCVPGPRGGWITFTRSVLPPPTDRTAHLAAAYSLPEWVAHRWIARFGEDEAIGLMKLANRPAPASVRPNRLRASAEQLKTRLAEEGVAAAVSPSGRTLRLPAHTNPAQLAAFERGELQPQDDSAAAVAPFLVPRPGERILDLCAAPGGKTTHIAELMNDEGVLIAVDVSRRKLRRLCENVRRLGLAVVECVASDGVRFASDHPGEFDAVLVDAPCSNSGVLRRRVEARWRLNDTSLGELTEIQRRLLQAAAATVRVGGRLVYSTCSLEPEENEDLVRQCLGSAEMALEREQQILPSETADGAYMARLRKGERAE